MEFTKIIIIGIVTCFACLIVKQVKPEIAVIIGLTGGILILIFAVDLLVTLIESFKIIFLKTGITQGVLAPICKMIGIGYLCEFSANICADTGNASIADKIMLAGKILILIISLPIINTVIDAILGLL